MVDKVCKVVSKESSRPILQGIKLTVENNTIRMVATDSFRLAVCDSNVETPSPKPFCAIVDGGTFHDVLALPSVEDTVQIGIAANQIVFSFGNQPRLPTHRRQLPRLPPAAPAVVRHGRRNRRARVQRRAQACLGHRRAERVGALRRRRRRRDDAHVRQLPEQGESSELLNVSAEGQSLSIALNYHYVSDCLAAVSGNKEMRLELQGPTQPGIFKCNGRVNYLYLLMPVRL